MFDCNKCEHRWCICNKQLFKFRSNNEQYIMDIIVNDKIWFSTPRELVSGDEYECNPPIIDQTTKKGRLKTFEKHIKHTWPPCNRRERRYKARKGFKQAERTADLKYELIFRKEALEFHDMILLSCFSYDSFNEHAWIDHAANHTGVCFVFNTQVLCENMRALHHLDYCPLQKVSYDSIVLYDNDFEMYRISDHPTYYINSGLRIRNDINPSFPTKKVERVFYTKSDCFSWEKEYRILMFCESVRNGTKLTFANDFVANPLESVILGRNISDDLRNAIINVAALKNISVKEELE